MGPDRRMLVLGLTGSVGMGKSTAVGILRGLGVPVHDADAEVHRLLGPGGGAVDRVTQAFPHARTGERIDRCILGRLVFDDRAALKRLEAILHPLVRAAERRFLSACRARGAPVAVLDIPLLFETGSDRRCDGVIVVTAPAWLQRARVMKRPGMTEPRFRAILARQLPDRLKRRRADWVLQSGPSRAQTRRALEQILREAATRGLPSRRGPGQTRRHA